MIQLGTLQDPLLRVYGQVSAQVRKISTKQNLINPRYTAQHAKHEIACRKSRIPIHAAEHISSAASLLSACDEPHLIDFQVLRGHAYRPRTSLAARPAMVGASSGPPDSMTRTCAPDADNSAARTEPAAPAPTTTKSYRLSSFDWLII